MTFNRRLSRHVLLVSLFIYVFSTSRAMAALEWEPIVEMDGHLFPSYVLATATMKPRPVFGLSNVDNVLGDPFSLFGARVHAEGASTIRVRIAPNSLMEESSFQVNVPKGGASELVIKPPINYRYDQLLRIKQAAPVSLTIEVLVDGRQVGQLMITLTVHSVNDCVFLGSGGVEANDRFLDLFAAYANESHPWVDELLRDALATGLVSQFDDYQSGDPSMVLRQVYSVWHVLQKRGIKYSNVVTPSAVSGSFNSQHVRLFDESVSAHQANCVDGTVMMASVLRKIGIDPFLIIVPGHMFLAFSMDATGSQVVGLETTMIGEASKVPEVVKSSKLGNLSSASPLMSKKLLSAIPAADRGKARSGQFVSSRSIARFMKPLKSFSSEKSFSSFQNALDAATSRLADGILASISLADARAAGMLPLGFAGGVQTATTVVHGGSQQSFQDAVGKLVSQLAGRVRVSWPNDEPITVTIGKVESMGGGPADGVDAEILKSAVESAILEQSAFHITTRERLDELMNESDLYDMGLLPPGTKRPNLQLAHAQATIRIKYGPSSGGWQLALNLLVNQNAQQFSAQGFVPNP